LYCLLYCVQQGPIPDLMSCPRKSFSLCWGRVNQNPPVHQCGWMVHTWVHLFHLSLSQANQGGELKLTFFFPSLSPSWFFFGGTLFFPHPHAHPGLTYLHTFRLLPIQNPGLLPPPTYPLIYLPTYLLTH
jgi:hypothetical protein